ncbi:MAG: hypothetical protein HYR48_08425 [Gemmatimonadetes bacterium]|nr:hypothetical protein [Gemmatimonadota bacterium]
MAPRCLPRFLPAEIGVAGEDLGEMRLGHEPGAREVALPAKLLAHPLPAIAQLVDRHVASRSAR